MTRPATHVPQPALSPSLRTLLALAAVVVLLAGVSLAREIVGPLALAIVLVVICEPLRGPLERRGWPRWTGTTAVIVVAYLVLLGMGALLWLAGRQFAQLVADFADELRASGEGFLAWLQEVGLDQEASSAAGAVLDPARKAPVLARIRHLNSGVRRYYVVNASFGAVVAIIDGLALAALGVPAPAVWAILAFVTNFIPNIGFVIGLIPPAILALVVGGWPLALAVVAAYCVINVVLQVLVQPKFVSDAVGLSLTLTFFSVVFWTLVIGPIGAILCIPLTLLVRALLLEPDERSGPLRRLSGDPHPERT